MVAAVRVEPGGAMIGVDLRPPVRADGNLAHADLRARDGEHAPARVASGRLGGADAFRAEQRCPGFRPDPAVDLDLHAGRIGVARLEQAHGVFGGDAEIAVFDEGAAKNVVQSRLQQAHLRRAQYPILEDDTGIGRRAGEHVVHGYSPRASDPHA